MVPTTEQKKCNFPEKSGPVNRMSGKMLRFIDEYLVDLNATQAAIRAGYSPNSACSIGIENLSKPSIKDVITKRQKELQIKTQMNQEWVLKRYKLLLDYSIEDFFNNDGSMKKLSEIPKEKLYAIGDFKCSKSSIGDEKNKITVNKIKDIKLPDKKGVLDSISKILGLFELDNAQKRSNNNTVMQINVELSD